MNNKTYTVQHRTGEQGFTLVELSIVLVIIGLIIGGVLVGQNMIKAAELRATISQIEKFSTAVNTFRSKYGGTPGDFNRANRFGLGANGDGDGQLEDANGAITEYSGELAEFWSQLSLSNMIDAPITLYPVDASGNTVGVHFPASKHGVGGIVAYSMSGFNNFHIGVANSTDDDVNYADTLLIEDAYTIDLKTDDGVGSTGSVRAMVATALADNTDDCLEQINAGADPDDYDLDADTVSCQLRLRMF